MGHHSSARRLRQAIDQSQAVVGKAMARSCNQMITATLPAEAASTASPSHRRGAAPARRTRRRPAGRGVRLHGRHRAERAPRRQVVAGAEARAVAVLQFDDDVGPPREHHLRRHLHRLALDVAEHVVAAGDLEHVVQEPVAAARVDVLQRARLAAEHEQRQRARPSGDARARSPAGGARGRDASASASAARPTRAPERRIVVVTSREVAVPVREHRDAGARRGCSSSSVCLS